MQKKSKHWSTLINPLVDNEKRWSEAKKAINFDFGETECFCQLCYFPTNAPSKNMPPNIWCENLHIWKQQFFPCCCRHFCDAKKDLIEDLGPCECPRCCVCQNTNTRCDTCKNKTHIYIFCSHIKHDHEPCLFQSQLWNKLNEEIDLTPDVFDFQKADDADAAAAATAAAATLSAYSSDTYKSSDLVRLHKNKDIL